MDPTLVEPSPKALPKTRAIRLGAAFWIVGPIQFVTTMIVVQLTWTTPYSLANNPISDLGAAYCQTNTVTGLYVCSPWHLVFNISAVVLGILIVAGTFVANSTFSSRSSASLGSAFLALSGLGAIMVGLFPEDLPGMMHYWGSILGLVGGGVGVLLLGLSMNRDERWVRYRTYSIVSGLVILVTFVIEVGGPPYGPLGFGGMERVAMASLLLWFVVAGSRTIRMLADEIFHGIVERTGSQSTDST